MKGRHYTFVVIVLALSFSGCFKKNIPVAPPVYSVASVEYQHSYGDAVRVAPSPDEFVICTSCPEPTALERVPKPVPISINFTSSSAPSSQAAVLAAPGTPIRPVPGNFSHIPIAPVSTPSTSLAVRQVDEVKKSAILSLPVSTIVSLPTSSTLNDGARLEKSAGPLNNESSKAVTTVYFRLGSSVLTHDELQKISRMMDSYKNKNVVVTGFTCNVGSKKINDRLAIRRAMAVAKVLKQAGVKPLMVSGTGKCCYISDDQRLNRRVEIRITGNVQ